MANLHLWGDRLTDLALWIPEPIQPFSMDCLAASGLFTRIEIKNSSTPDGDFVIDAADVVRRAVAVREALVREEVRRSNLPSRR